MHLPDGTKSAGSIVVGAAITDECDEMVHKVHACCSTKQMLRNLMTGVFEFIIQIFPDLAAHPAQCESKEQGCNTTLERGADVAFSPKSHFVTRV